jgi:cell division protein FtsL
MSPRTAAAAALRHATAIPVPGHAQPRPRRAPSRRRSGAARPRTAAGNLPIQRGSFDFARLLDRLLLGPAYIALVGLLLAGIVFFNVGVLELNHGIAGTDLRATQLERENAQLTQTLATLASSERIQQRAIARGLVLPQPGDVHYLHTTRHDALRALQVMTAPNPATTSTQATSALVSQASQQAATTTTSATTTAATAATP